MPDQVQIRAVACLKALAIGDAIGKQTETLPYAQIRNWYLDGVHGFEGRPGEVIPRYKGKRYEWKIGETTDDTEQTLAVARAILRDGEARHSDVGRELLSCKKSLHPGVSMWAFVEAGDPSRVATDGDGCGAAMRAAPVGLLYGSSRMESIVHAAYEISIPTHGGQSGVCAAAAVAAAVSAAVDGRPSAGVLEAALEAAKAAERLRPPTRDLTIADAIAAIYADLSSRRPLRTEYIAENHFPATPETKAPLAICLALLTESAEATALIAANTGGDSDSVASIGSAIAGALRPETVNESWFEVVRAANPDDVVVAAAVSVAALRS